MPLEGFQAERVMLNLPAFYRLQWLQEVSLNTIYSLHMI